MYNIVSKMNFIQQKCKFHYIEKRKIEREDF